MSSPADVQGAFLSGHSIGEKKLAALLLASGAVRGVDLRRLLERKPKRPLLYLLVEERLVDAAELDRLIARLEQERESHISEGDRLCRIANPGLAVERYSLALDLQPRDADAFRRRGIAFALLHQAKEALEDLDRAVALAPREHAALDARALVRQELGDEPGAIEDLTLAISIAPCSRYHADRARIWSACGQDQHALADWSRALDLAPDRVDWRHHRALGRLRCADFDGACQDFLEVIERANRSSPIWRNARIVVRRLVVEGRVGREEQSRVREVLASLESRELVLAESVGPSAPLTRPMGPSRVRRGLGAVVAVATLVSVFGVVGAARTGEIPEATPVADPAHPAAAPRSSPAREMAAAATPGVPAVRPCPRPSSQARIEEYLRRRHGGVWSDDEIAAKAAEYEALLRKPGTQ